MNLFVSDNETCDYRECDHTPDYLCSWFAPPERPQHIYSTWNSEDSYKIKYSTELCTYHMEIYVQRSWNGLHIIRAFPFRQTSLWDLLSPFRKYMQGPFWETAELANRITKERWLHEQYNKALT